MIVAISVADTAMAAFVGETAVAGISLVTTVDTLVKTQISALAIGGSIAISQYIGKDEPDNGSTAMKMVYYSILFVALVVGLSLFTFRKEFLTLIVGNVEPAVMKNAQPYFLLSVFSYPFFAVYLCCVSVFSCNGQQQSIHGLFYCNDGDEPCYKDNLNLHI